MTGQRPGHRQGELPLLEDLALLDTHNDLAAELRRWTGGRVDGIATLPARFQTDLSRMREGGLRAQVWSVFVPGYLDETSAVVSVLEQIDLVLRMVAAHPDRLALVRRMDEYEPAIRSGRIASFLGIEGGHAIAGSLGVLRMYAALGVRTFGLTHNSSVPWADSATDAPLAGGLDADGRRIVAELNRLGIVVDLSHAAESTQRAALDVSTAPVMFSHSGVADVCAHPRNVSTPVLQALAAGGGTLQLTFVPSFLTEDRRAWTAEAAEQKGRLGLGAPRPWPPSPRPSLGAEEAHAAYAAGLPPRDPDAQAAWEAWLEVHPAPSVTVSDVADHVDAARDIVGVDALGLGGDFDGTDEMPVGLSDVSGYPLLLAELSARGWSRSELRLLAGENTVRVLSEAERIGERDGSVTAFLHE